MIKRITHRHTCAHCGKKIMGQVADVEQAGEDVVFMHAECKKSRELECQPVNTPPIDP